MTPRSAALAALLVTAGIALAGCGSDQTATDAPKTPTINTAGGALNGRPDASSPGGNRVANPPNGANVKNGRIRTGSCCRPAPRSAGWPFGPPTSRHRCSCRTATRPRRSGRSSYPLPATQWAP